jgi:hypothetical protein
MRKKKEGEEFFFFLSTLLFPTLRFSKQKKETEKKEVSGR